MGHKGDTAPHANNKVLPISALANDQCGSTEKKGKPKRDKTKAIFRMMNLLRWASSAKSEKGGKHISRKVLYIQNHGTVKEAAHHDDSSFNSPKCNFRWDADRCSTSSCAYTGSSSSTASSTRTDEKQIKPIINSSAKDVSAPDSNEKKATTSSQDSELCTSRRGNWITTDDQFVVLEFSKTEK
ncbi:uncharacterized protein LOC122091963 [Macadamia integrifolia]|uniref:uncharacterized protein LOC122091963 n=1 Tax=Macadamia integrifolia TaxID=60698 RepID=UPI001C4E65F1|nr:uncharacterized protein LOC122091963 [Macadamia integrifolia]